MASHRQTHSESWVWRGLQIVGILGTVLLISGLVVAPEISLLILWSILIPIVPASLLLNPLVWRNVCPLATLNMAGNRWGLRRRAGLKWTTRANLIGLALFAILVPARRFLFNEHGTALAITIVAVALGALVLGVLFDGRAGFCNALCPVLPVERLYGQRPLLRVGRARCVKCSACARGCIDLSPERSVQLATKSRGPIADWLRSPLGVFAAALPGFIVGYFTLPDGPLSTAVSVYLWIGALSIVSYLVVFSASRLRFITAARGLPMLAGLAALLYYWFAAPSVAAAVQAPVAMGQALRVAAFGLVILWLRAALAPERSARV